MISARVQLDDYTNRVLNVVKARFDLKDKSEALNKFVELYGDEVVEKGANEEYVEKIIEIDEEHFKKYGRRKMSIEDLDKLCDLP